MWSFWEQQSFIGQPDLVVIGSGIVGLTAAIEYRKINPKSHILLLEAGHLPAGASTKNAGFACFGSPTEILADLAIDSEEVVLNLIEKRLKGLYHLRYLLGDDGIDYKTYGSYELFTHKDQPKYNLIREQLPYLNALIQDRIGFEPFHVDYHICDQAGFRNTRGAIRITGEGQINTGKMMLNLLKLAKHENIHILNGLKALSFESNSKGVLINTLEGPIFTKKCIIATNGFAKDLLPKLEILPARAQVLITKPLEHLKFYGTFHFDSGYYYFRTVGDRILFGGGRNLDFERETTTINAINPEIQNQLIHYLKTMILPNTPFEIEHQWTGIMGVGSSKQVILKQIDTHVYAGVRLGGMGIAIGSLVGKELAMMI